MEFMGMEIARDALSSNVIIWLSGGREFRTLYSNVLDPMRGFRQGRSEAMQAFSADPDRARVPVGLYDYIQERFFSVGVASQRPTTSRIEQDAPLSMPSSLIVAQRFDHDGIRLKLHVPSLEFFSTTARSDSVATLKFLRRQLFSVFMQYVKDEFHDQRDSLPHVCTVPGPTGWHGVTATATQVLNRNIDAEALRGFTVAVGGSIPTQPNVPSNSHITRTTGVASTGENPIPIPYYTHSIAGVPLDGSEVPVLIDGTSNGAGMPSLGRSVFPDNYVPDLRQFYDEISPDRLVENSHAVLPLGEQAPDL